MLRVEHYGQFFCARCILARHDRSRMRARAESRVDAM